MRPGPPRGTTASLHIDVTDAMCASVGGRQTYPVYGTRALLENMDQVCRHILEPHLEAGEQAIDAAVEVRHREPVPVGARVALDATVATVEPTRIVVEVLVRYQGRVVARGTLEQELVRTEDYRETVAGIGVAD